MTIYSQPTNERCSTGDYFIVLSLRIIPKFQLIYWCGNFVETRSLRRVSGEPSKTLWKQCVSTEFPLQEVRWNYGILCSLKLQLFWKINWKEFQLYWRNFISLEGFSLQGQYLYVLNCICVISNLFINRKL